MAEARPLDWRVVRTIALVFLAIKLVLLVVAHPFMDETYYFLWGQHPALSYFDHPSLVGWTSGLAALVGGWSIFGLRLAVFVTLLGDLAILYAFARLDGDGWQPRFWLTATLFLATPMLFILSSVALPDHLLIVFSLLAVYAVERLRRSLETGTADLRCLYLAGLAIGLATLSKYTGALLGAGLVLTVLFSPKLRPLLRSPHLYLAALLAFALQAPVLLWNLDNGFASLGFIVGGRAGLRNLLHFSGLSGFALGALAVLSPSFVWAALRFGFDRKDGAVFPRLVFWLSTIGFLVASLFTNILVHWNIVAYVVVLPFLAPWFRSRLLTLGQVAYGVIGVVLVTFNYAVAPVMAFVSTADQTSAWSYGWDQVAAEVMARRGDAQFIAATDYALASPLAFALHDPAVLSLSPRHDQFDYWLDPAVRRGQSAILVADRWRPLSDAIKAQFASLAELSTVDVVVFGKLVDRYTLYRGEGFVP